MATKKKAKRGKKVRKGGLFKKTTEETINPTKKFIKDMDNDEGIELTESGKSHFETLKKQKYIESMEPPVLLDDLFHNFEVIKLNNSLFLKLEENETLYEGVKYYLKDGENIWLFFDNKAILLDYALMEELSFEYQNEDILKYSPAIFNGNIFFVSNKEVHIYNIEEQNWQTYSISGEITSSVIIENSLIFLVIDFTKLVCLNDSFKETWSFITEGYLLNTPVVSDFVYITSSDGMLYKLDNEGDIAWSFNSKSSLETPPLLFENTIILSSMSGKILFVSKEDKSEIAVIDLGFHLINKPVVKDEMLYVFNRRFLYKIDLASYKILDIIMFENPIESISTLDNYLHIRMSDSKSIVTDDTFTNINVTNFNGNKAPFQHINFLVSIDENYNLLKTELV